MYKAGEGHEDIVPGDDTLNISVYWAQLYFYSITIHTFMFKQKPRFMA